MTGEANVEGCLASKFDTTTTCTVTVLDNGS